MALALFDLDDTLIVDNCETSWLCYLASLGLYDHGELMAQLDEFGRQYVAGEGSLEEYVHFTLAPLTQHPLSRLQRWREDWFSQFGAAMIASGSRDLLQSHREAGDTLLIISASHTFCVEPFARALGVENFLGTRAVLCDGRYSGDFIPPACFAADKIKHLQDWLQVHPHSLRGSSFYSDSRNDIPLLEYVENPVATHPDDYLRQYAEQRGWPIVNLR